MDCNFTMNATILLENPPISAKSLYFSAKQKKDAGSLRGATRRGGAEATAGDTNGPQRCPAKVADNNTWEAKERRGRSPFKLGFRNGGVTSSLIPKYKGLAFAPGRGQQFGSADRHAGVLRRLGVGETGSGNRGIQAPAQPHSPSGHATTPCLPFQACTICLATGRQRGSFLDASITSLPTSTADSHRRVLALVRSLKQHEV